MRVLCLPIGSRSTSLASLPVKRVVLPSDVVVTVYVGPGGKAQSVGFASAKSEIDDAWAECAEKLAMGWRLTDPRGVIAKLAIRYRAN